LVANKCVYKPKFCISCPIVIKNSTIALHANKRTVGYIEFEIKFSYLIGNKEKEREEENEKTEKERKRESQ
jgi:hypothetical protein